MNALKNFFRLHPAKDALRTVIVLIGLATVPLIYAGLLTWSNQDPTGHLDRVPAAIVNEDRGSHDPDLTLGADLTNELVSERSGSNFEWKTMSAADAQKALDDGKVYAILTVPKDFSANAGSVAKNDPAAAKKAQVTITTNDATNMISGNIASAIATTVTDSLSGKVSEGYLENIYAGFTTVHGKMGDAAKGATDLADGSVKAKDGSGDLVVGLGDLHSGAVRLSEGAGQLDTGATKVNTAAGQLAGGASDVNEGAIALKGGVTDAHDGAGTLASGLDTLEEKTSDLPGATEKLADGATKLDSGAQDLAAGAGRLREGTADLSTGAAGLDQGMSDALTGATRVRDGASTLAGSSPALASGAAELNEGLGDLEKAWPVMTDEQKLAAVKQLHEGSTPLAEGASKLDGGLQNLSSGANDLVGTEGSKSSGPTGLTALAAGANKVAVGASDLATGADTLATGTENLAEKTPTLAEGADTLHSGAVSLSEGVTKLSNGATDLEGGLGTLEEGATTLAGGTGKLAEGATALSTGTGDLETAAGQLAEGSTNLADGSQSAEQGARDLDQGLGDLSEGATDLKDGMVKGAKDVPSFSDQDAKDLAKVGARPVDLVKERKNEVAGYGSGLAPYFMSLSLWVGALGFFLMVNALNPRLLGSQAPALAVALGSYLPAAAMAVVQSALMVATVHVMVGIEFAHLWPAFWIAVLASLAFMAVNQALVVLLGPPGRYLALILIVLQLSAAGATYPVETTPGFFQKVHGWLPITHLVEAFRSAIAGGNHGFSDAVWVLGTYLVVALVLLTAGVALKRARAGRKQRREQERLGVEPLPA